jgi:hypothetical protein
MTIMLTFITNDCIKKVIDRKDDKIKIIYLKWYIEDIKLF